MHRTRRLSLVVACFLFMGPAGVAMGSNLDFWSGVVRHHHNVIVQVSHHRGRALTTVLLSWQCKTGPSSADDYLFRLEAPIRHNRLKAIERQAVNSGSGSLSVNLRDLRAGHGAEGTVSWRATDINGHRCSGHGTWSGKYLR
jgi:hypothetical protein